jgi:hypothetical protein
LHRPTTVQASGVPLEPVHQLTTIAAGDGTTNKQGSCRCGQWATTRATSDDVAIDYQRHLHSAQGVLL